MATRKLISSKGTLLGTVTFPDHWAVRLDEAKYIRFEAASPAEKHEQMMRSLGGPEYPVDMVLRVGTLAAGHGYMRDTVELHGITLECFEQLSGCSYAPSMAYLRSIMRGE